MSGSSTPDSCGSASERGAERDVIFSLLENSKDADCFEYAVSKDWWQRWQRWVDSDDQSTSVSPGPVTMKWADLSTIAKKPRPPLCFEMKTIESGQSEVGLHPGDIIDLSHHDLSNNMYLAQDAWTRLVKTFGVADDHKLSRKHTNTKVTSMVIVIAFLYNKPAYVKRKYGSENKYLMSMESWEATCRYLMVDKRDEYDYIHCQIRKMFRVPPERQSRILKAEGIRPPRNSALAERGGAKEKRHSRQVFKLRPVFRTSVEEEGQDDWDDQFLLTDQHFIFLETLDDGQPWASGVQGLPTGELHRFNELTCNLVKPDVCQEVPASPVDIAGAAARTADAVARITRGEVERSIHRALVQVQVRSDDVEVKEKKLDFLSQELRAREKSVRTKEEELKSLEAELDQRSKDLDEAIYQLDSEREKFKRSVDDIKQVNKVKESMVRLRVGDHVYTTSLLTVTRDPDSMLSAMFSGRHALEKDSEGNYFIDRDGTHFRHVLNFLRDGGANTSIIPQDRQTLLELLNETEYYMLQGLADTLRGMLDELET